MDVMENLGSSNIPWYFKISIGATVFILVISTIYTIKNLFKTWKRKSVEENPKAPLSDNDKDKITGNEGSGSGDISDEATEKRKKELLEEVTKGNIDPAEYCDHIQSEVKKAKMRVTEKRLTETLSTDQMEEEREIQRKQLEEIFNLMQSQSEKFGVESMEDVNEQMKLYIQ